MTINRRLNLDYGMIQACYWGIYLMAGIFVSVYMLAKGYSNTSIGLVLAAGNVMAILLQIFVSDLTDKSKRIDEIKVLFVFLFVMTISAGMILIIDRKCLPVLVLYILYITFHSSSQPFVNAMPGMLRQKGADIAFGPARAAGSLSVAFFCLLMGWAITKYGEDVLPVQSLIGIVLFAIILLRIRQNSSRSAALQTHLKDAAATSHSDEKISMRAFVKRNKLFLLMSAGLVAIFMETVIIENYIYQIVEDIGGDVNSVGIITFLLSIFEVPAMFGFNWLKHRFSYSFLLNMSVIFCALKVIGIFLAKSMLVIYLLQPLQILGLGLLMPTMIIFIDDLMDRQEAVRGQMVYTATATIGYVLGSLAGGVVLDTLGVHNLLLITTIITVLGTILVCLVSGKVEARRHRIR